MHYLPPRLSVFALLVLACATVVRGQRLDMTVLGKWRNIEIPFDLENDFIVIPIFLNNQIPLRFIVDTGAENTVILDRTFTDVLDINYQRTFHVRGADMKSDLTAHLAVGVSMRLADRLLARNRTVLVLEENYFNLERITGTNIHGILGADFLTRFVVDFDFRKQVMTLHDPQQFSPRKNLQEMDADFVRNRPYLNLGIGILRDSLICRRLLLDTGAGLTLLMHTSPEHDHVDLPTQTVPANIASGLGGTLSGSVGRSRQVAVADRRLTNVITYFQDVDSSRLEVLNEREGIIGNRILQRFRIFIDYPRQKVYFRPDGRKWKQRFIYDRSGLSLLAGGENLRKFSVSNVIPGSPADEAGVQVRDRLRAINGINTSLLSLESIMRRLQGKPGRQIKLRVYRGGRLYDLTFRLRDLI